MFTLPSGLGCGLPHQNAENNPAWYKTALEVLDPPWWYNWLYNKLEYDNYIPMVWECNVEQITKVLPTIRKHSDRLFFFGNEPERIQQSDTSPEVFALGIQELYRQLDGHKIHIALPGVLHDFLSNGKNWTRAYLDAGGPMPDVWHIHLYEPNKAMIDSRIKAWKRDIDDTRPLIVSEGGSWRSDSNRPQEVMDALEAACDDGRLQAAAHFSAHYKLDMPYLNLIDESCNLTDLGRKYTKEVYTTYLPHVTNKKISLENRSEI